MTRRSSSKKSHNRNPTGIGGFTFGHTRSRGPRKRGWLSQLMAHVMDVKIGAEEYCSQYLDKTLDSPKPGDMLDAIKYMDPPLTHEEPEEDIVIESIALSEGEHLTDDQIRQAIEVGQAAQRAFIDDMIQKKKDQENDSQ